MKKNERIFSNNDSPIVVSDTSTRLLTVPSKPETTVTHGTSFGKNAQNRFCLIVRNVARANPSASGTASISDLSRMMSAASRAMSLARLTAMPRSACYNAGASLMPSPTNATFSPCC